MHLFCIMTESWLLADKYVSTMEINGNYIFNFSISLLLLPTCSTYLVPSQQRNKKSQSKTVNAYVPLHDAQVLPHGLFPTCQRQSPELASTAPSGAWALHRARAAPGWRNSAMAPHGPGARASAKAELRTPSVRNTFPAPLKMAHFSRVTLQEKG